MAEPFLERLRDQFDATIQIAVLDFQDVVYVAKVNSSSQFSPLLKLAHNIQIRLSGFSRLKYIDWKEFKQMLASEVVKYA